MARSCKLSNGTRPEAIRGFASPVETPAIERATLFVASVAFSLRQVHRRGSSDLASANPREGDYLTGRHRVNLLQDLSFFG
jgi:hypothetical protein